MRPIALFVFLVVSCSQPAKPAPVAPAPVGDASALLDIGDNPTPCKLMCFDYAEAGCREARPDCVDTCERALSDGLMSHRLLNCVATAG